MLFCLPVALVRRCLYLCAARARSVAGGKEESIQQPVWSEDGSTLYFIGDKSGWWNLYRYHDGQVAQQAWQYTSKRSFVTPTLWQVRAAALAPWHASCPCWAACLQVSLVHGMDVEFGFPPWVFGTQSYEVWQHACNLTWLQEGGCTLQLMLLR